MVDLNSIIARISKMQWQMIAGGVLIITLAMVGVTQTENNLDKESVKIMALEKDEIYRDEEKCIMPLYISKIENNRWEVNGGNYNNVNKAIDAFKQMCSSRYQYTLNINCKYPGATYSKVMLKHCLL